MLGTLGIVGLMLLGGQYLLGQRRLAALEVSENTAAAVSALFARALTDLTQAHQWEAEFRFVTNESVIGRQAVAAAAVQHDLADVHGRADAAEAAGASGAAAANALRTYTRRFADLVALQRYLGLAGDDGLAGALSGSAEAAEQGCEASGDPKLALMASRLRSSEGAFRGSASAADAGQFIERIGGLLFTAQHSPALASPVQQHLATLLAGYQRDFLSYVEQTRLIALARLAVGDAYEETRVAAEAAREQAAARAAQRETEIAGLHGSIARRTFWMLGIAVAAVGVLTFVLGHLIARPLERVAAATIRLASGDGDVTIAEFARADEIGDVARALAVFRKLTIAHRDLTSQREVQSNAEQAAYRQAVQALAGQVEAAIGSVVGSAGDAAASMRAGAEAVVATINHTRARAGAVEMSSLQCQSGVQTVAAATEQLATTLNEVSRQVNQSAAATARASAQMQISGKIVQALASGAVRVEGIVALISNVAARTNLLALNATIEAARAGPAGRGFAVVAVEIKALAQQTASATEDIRLQIVNMQAATTQAVEALQAVGAEFAGMDLATSTVAETVEQQHEATQEIARCVVQVAAGVVEVSEAVSGLRNDAEHAGSVAELARQASDRVAVIAQELSGSLRVCLADLRARA